MALLLFFPEVKRSEASYEAKKSSNTVRAHKSKFFLRYREKNTGLRPSRLVIFKFHGKIALLNLRFRSEIWITVKPRVVSSVGRAAGF